MEGHRRITEHPAPRGLAVSLRAATPGAVPAAPADLTHDADFGHRDDMTRRAMLTMAAELSAASILMVGCGPREAKSAQRSFEVLPGKFAELNAVFEQGATITAEFSGGDETTAWDVHSHTHEGGTTIHDDGTGGAGTITFVAPRVGAFSILWNNEGSAPIPLQVSVTLGTGSRIHSWVPD